MNTIPASKYTSFISSFRQLLDPQPCKAQISFRSYKIFKNENKNWLSSIHLISGNFMDQKGKTLKQIMGNITIKTIPSAKNLISNQGSKNY